jgi:ribonuclease P protein component
MFPRDLRLRREGDVQRARSRGKAWSDGPIVVRVAANPTDPDRNRYTVVAGKKVGKSVQRNRAKRVVREALRHWHPDLRCGHDIVVIIRGTHDQLPDLATAQAVMDRIIRRARLDVPRAPGSATDPQTPVTGPSASPAADPSPAPGLSRP